MLQPQMVVNDCYILQSRVGDDVYTEHWIATAIFSATRFLLRFIKNNSNTDVLETLRKNAVRCYHVEGPAIADFIEVDLYKGLLFISSEYHDEKPLSSVLNKNGSWQIDQICIFMTVLARGTHTFHSQNIIYGSLNEESILTGLSGIHQNTLKIQKPSMLSLLPLITSDDKRFFNTYAYIAPEYKVKGTLCEASDVYSLGVLLVKLITGKLPFPDSTKDISSNSASLRFVANALFRRGIYEDLVRIALRSLLPDPARRYASCIDMIADMRYFMQKTHMSQPDLYDYSSTTSEIDKAKNSALYPLLPRIEADTVEQLERQELVPIKDEDSWSIDDYINNGIRIVQKESSKEFFATPKNLDLMQNFHIDETFFGLKENPKPSPVDSPAPEITPEPSVATAPTLAPKHQSSLAPAPSTAPSAAKIKKITQKQRKKKSEHIFLPTSATNQMVSSSAPEGIATNWNYTRIQFSDVWNVVGYSIKRAQKGIGCFRYIQEPTQNSLSVHLFHELETLKDSCLFVNLGTFARYGKADIHTFLMMLRHGITRELSRESKGSLSYLAKQVKKQDTFGAFSSAPIGTLLYKKNTPEITKKMLLNAEYQESIIHSLFAFSRKKKPLVLILRGGESIHHNLNDFLNTIASGVLNVPVCIFVFFDHAPFPPWHTLSIIRKK